MGPILLLPAFSQMEQKGKEHFPAYACACWILLFISSISLFENLFIWLGKMLSNLSLCAQLPPRPDEPQ